MFEQTFKNIDDVLWKEAGCTTELDYTEQTSWMLFLKYLDDLEKERALEAELHGRTYSHIIDDAHRWSVWAAPKKANGAFDHDRALTGPDLIDTMSIASCSPTLRASAPAPPARTRSSTRSARSRTSSAAAIRSVTRWSWSMP
jgi:hypothetical protein